MAFVTVRALTKTESPEKIVFYFCLIGSLISVIPMFWVWRPYTLTELQLSDYCRHSGQFQSVIDVKCLQTGVGRTNWAGELCGDFFCRYMGVFCSGRRFLIYIA